jgi:L-alanine-DL-glutamate epimerase-like enolase superfamily enzyme
VQTISKVYTSCASKGLPAWTSPQGEYGYDLPYFQRMLDAGAVDCVQADVTRRLGITGVLKVGALCDTRSMDLSLHCAPQISAQVGAAVRHCGISNTSMTTCGSKG